MDWEWTITLLPSFVLKLGRVISCYDTTCGLLTPQFPTVCARHRELSLMKKQPHYFAERTTHSGADHRTDLVNLEKSPYVLQNATCLDILLGRTGGMSHQPRGMLLTEKNVSQSVENGQTWQMGLCPRVINVAFPPLFMTHQTFTGFAWIWPQIEPFIF